MNIIYTCITKRYDDLKHIIVPQGWRAIAFIDNLTKKQIERYNVEFPQWEIINIPKGKYHDKIHREIKILPHKFLPAHSLSVWIDGNIQPLVGLDEFVRGKESGIWAMKHPERNCIYKEAEACIALKKDTVKAINRQIFVYYKTGYPKNYGLNATGILVRDNSDSVNEFCDEWWRITKFYSKRDQLSFNFCQWLNNFPINEFNFLEGFNKVKHNKKSK